MDIIRESSRWIRVNRIDLSQAIEALIGTVSISIPVNRAGKLLEFSDERSREKAYKILEKL